MFARVEVAVRPEFVDPEAEGWLRRFELARPGLRKRIRWARCLAVYWLDLPLAREELIRALPEVFWDPVLQWLFTGNLLPSASGKHGTAMDLMEAAPQRPGRFFGVERRLRSGVTDNVGRTALEALEIVLGRRLEGARVTSGNLLVLEGVEIDADTLEAFASEVLCNELVETWSTLDESELRKSDRFSQERIRREMPKVPGSRATPTLALGALGGSTLPRAAGVSGVERIVLGGKSDAELVALSQARLWALSLAEMRAIRDFAERRRAESGERDAAALTDVEIEILAQTWSEHCKHKIFGATVRYREDGAHSPFKLAIPENIHSLFKSTIVDTTTRLPKSWLLSVFDDNAGIVALDDESAICIKVETHNSPSALDPYGGALTGIVGVNRDILGCGRGAMPIANMDVFCVAPLDSPAYSSELPDRLMHPRRILDGIRRGVEHGGNKSGIPTVNGALYFDERYLGKPLVYCGTVGIMPRQVQGVSIERKSIEVGDRIVMAGGRIGKDGIHGATFSSLALNEHSPSQAVQLGDPITQKRMADFLLEARDLGLYRTLTDNGAGGLSSSVGELARLSGGARLDVSRAPVKYPGLKPYELVISESQERMTLAVPPANWPALQELARRRGVEVTDLGEFTRSGRFEVWMGEALVAKLELEFLHGGAPQLELEALWAPHEIAPARSGALFRGAKPWEWNEDAPRVWQALLAQPNVASKEWLIRQYDHEVQGSSVVKPADCTDAAVLKPKPLSTVGVVIASGLQPRLSDVDAALMAQAAVDEAVRNALCVGAEFGKPEHVLALVDNFCWPDPTVSTPEGAERAAALVRACYGLRQACLALGIPLVSGKDSMKNNYAGRWKGKEIEIAVPPTLLMTALGRMPDVRWARTGEVKTAGSGLYLLGPGRLSLLGSELDAWCRTQEKNALEPSHSTRLGTPEVARELVTWLGGEGREGKLASAESVGLRAPLPDWERALRLYRWLGEPTGAAKRLRALHDVSDGGVLVAVAEMLQVKGLGAALDLSAWQARSELRGLEACFGEGFHTLIAEVAEADQSALEEAWAQAGVEYSRLGQVEEGGRVSVRVREGAFELPIQKLRDAWRREGYWQ